MNATVIYIAQDENQQLAWILKEHGIEPNLVCRADHEAELPGLLRRADDGLIVTVGGFYSGAFPAAAAIARTVGCGTTLLPTARPNALENNHCILSIPQGFVPLTQHDGMIWGFSGSSAEGKPLLCICEPDDSLLYPYSGGLHLFLSDLLRRSSASAAQPCGQMPAAAGIAASDPPTEGTPPAAVQEAEAFDLQADRLSGIDAERGLVQSEPVPYSASAEEPMPPASMPRLPEDGGFDVPDTVASPAVSDRDGARREDEDAGRPQPSAVPEAAARGEQSFVQDDHRRADAQADGTEPFEQQDEGATAPPDLTDSGFEAHRPRHALTAEELAGANAALFSETSDGAIAPPAVPKESELPEDDSAFPAAESDGVQGQTASGAQTEDVTASLHQMLDAIEASGGVQGQTGHIRPQHMLTAQELAPVSAESEPADAEAADAALPDSEAQKQSRPARRGKRLIAILVLAAVLLVGALGFSGYYYVLEPNAYDSAVRRYRQLYGTGDAEELPQEYLPQFAALYKESKDIAGWLTIPETGINYPVAKCSKQVDYAASLLDGSRNRFGTLYLDENYRFLDFNYNTVIYGGSQDETRSFGELAQYCSPSFVVQANLIQMNDISEENSWRVFGVLLFDPEERGGFDPTQNYFFDAEAFDVFLKRASARFLVTTDIEVNSDDQLLTLVTDGKGDADGLMLAVMARRTRPGESIGAVKAAKNSAALYPAKWYAAQGLTAPNLTEAVAAPLPSGSGGIQLGTGSLTSAQTNESTASPISGSVPGSWSSNGAASSSGSTLTTARTASTAGRTSTKSTTAKPATKPVTAKTTAKTTAKPTAKPTTKPSGGTSSLPTFRVRNNFDGKVYEDSADEIVAMVIEAEMGSSFELEALKAQAVAAYNYLLRSGAASGSTPSAPMKTAGSRSRQAVKAVAGEVLRYKGSLIESTYYAISAGKTANSAEVWGGDLPYLRSVDSSVDRNASGFQTVRRYSAANVEAWVKAEYGVDLSSVSDKSKWFSVSYDANKLYAVTVSLGGKKTVKGTSLRNDLFVSSRVGSSNVLRSHAYQIAYDKTNDRFTFTVKGYGHGVGLSQVGANFYAKNGWDYEKILKHYYPGVTLADA